MEARPNETTISSALHNMSADPLVAFVRNFHSPASEIDRVIQEKRNKYHYTIGKTSRNGMCSDNVAKIATDGVVKIFIESG